jgi:hypothetical protein
MVHIVLLAWELWTWLPGDCSLQRSDNFFVDVLGFAGTKLQVMVMLGMQYERPYAAWLLAVRTAAHIKLRGNLQLLRALNI